jgi:predicted MFS family arabinose efflux permease
MSVERTLFAFGGTMVMLTCLLALFHHPYWTWVTLFIGFNCLQSSFTGFCPPSWLMKKFGMKTDGASIAASHNAAACAQFGKATELFAGSGWRRMLHEG